MPFDSIQQIQGKNFAPAEPLRNAERTLKEGSSSDMSAFFREIYQETESQHQVARREHIEMGRMISILRAGKLTIKGDAVNGYVAARPFRNSDRSNFPLFPQNSETLKSKWEKAKPQFMARLQGDGYRTEIQMNEINTFMKTYFKDIFTPEKELQEAIEAQDYGTYIWQFFYDDKLNQMQKIVPVIQDQSKVVMKGYGACYDCGFEGEPEHFEKTQAAYPQCPQCESFRTTKMVAPSIAQTQEVTGIDYLTQGDISGAIRSFASVNYDLRVFAHESSYFTVKQAVPMRLIRQMFGNLEIQGGSVDDYGLNVMESLASRGGHIDGIGASDLNGNAAFLADSGVEISMYLKPEWYADFKLSNSEKTLSGTIPADVPFGELFPDGICVSGYDDLGFITGIYGERANISSGVYFLQSHSGYGKGVSDGVDIARDLNEIHSMAMAGLKRYGASGIFYDSSAGLTPEKIRNLFKPEKAVPVDLQQAGYDDIRKAIGQIQPNPVNPVLPQYAVQLSNLLNMAFLVGDFTQGMVQDVDINTFGGQQLAHAKAEEQKGAILTMKVAQRGRSAEIIYELFRKHIKMPRYYAAGTDRHAMTKGKWISGEELPENVKFDAVPESEIPTTQFEKRLAAGEMVEKAGGIGNFAQLIELSPKAATWYASKFGVDDLPFLDQHELMIVCLARLESVKELSEVFNTPQEIFAQMKKPLFVREQGHTLKAEFLGQILDDDEVAEWNPLAKATVQMLIEQHYEMQAQAEYLTEATRQRAAMQLQMDAMQMQKAMMQPQIDAQNQQAAAEQEQQIALELAGRVADDEQKAVDYEREQMAKDAELERNIALENVRSENNAQNNAQKLMR